MKKFYKQALSFTLVVLLGFASVVSINAAPGDTGEGPANAIHLTKTLVTPDPSVVSMPVDMTFEFEVGTGIFKPHGSDVADPSVTAPVIVSPTLTFSNSDIGAVANGAKTTHKQTEDLLTIFRSELANLKPGVYEYVITEKADTVTGLDSTKERVEYDSTSYTLRIFISRGTDGEPTIDGGTVEGPDGKVEPGPGTVVPGAPGENEIVDANGFNFRNVYSKDAGSVTPPDPDRPEAGFIVDKVIEGNLANAEDEFTFTLLMVANATTTGKTYTLDVAGTDVVVTPGTAVEFKLKGDQRAWLLNTPVGVEVQVKETNHGYYVANVFAQSDGTKQIGDVVAGDYVAGTDANTILGEKSNLAAYKNVWNKTTPTGIFIDNLPYIVLIGLVSLGMVTSVVMKRKSRFN